MNDVARAVGEAAMPSTERSSHGPGGHRGRLFRKYLLLILTLVTIALLASGAISIYFTYQEAKSSLADLQHEKALGAASRIEEYVHQIERQIAYAALPQLDPGDVELRRVEFLKLLRQAPEVTDVAQLDASGHERLAVSRLGMDSVGSGRDRAQEPAFRESKADRTWFGPVYFRKETEPYMTIAVRAAGEKGAVTVADVNLKFIWDVVSRIRIGDKGKAQVVDERGYLVADPDIGLVLRKTNLSALPHVKAAMTAPGDGGNLAMVSTDLAGKRVLTSMAPIESLKWNVFVEQPVSEVYAKLNASILRTALLLLAGLMLSALGALALARGMVRPIRTLEEGAQRIGTGDLDQRIIVRTGDELEALADQFNRMSGKLRESYAGLEQKVEARTRELASALEQQTAISAILRVISSSPTDVLPVLRAVAEHAARLCHSPYARVMVIDGPTLRVGAEYAVEPLSAGDPVPVRRSSITGRAVVDRATVHYADIRPIVADEFPEARDNIARLGCSAVLAVPLLREHGAYGAIFLFRREPGLFSPDQVALVETFARQAAIAIDNVRLFNETKEALEQQTAISEILRVIAATPGDEKPMLNAVAERALKLCDAAQATIVLAERDALRCVAAFGSTRTLTEGERMPLTRGSVAGRAMFDRAPFQIEDLAAASEDDLPVGRELQRRIGHRTALAVPLMREDHAIGAIQLWRMEKRHFSERQIALVKTFADQAAIAIENVRLFNETKEALEQQQASAEVLSVIGSSVSDTAPVFTRIAQSCKRLFDVSAISINLVGDDGLVHLGYYDGPNGDQLRGIFPGPLNPDSSTGLAILERRVIHHPDVLAGTEVPAYTRKSGEVTGVRSVVFAPMIWKDRGIGVIVVGREVPQPFTTKEIALLKTFADQAVIAIQNARLFNETREALERQTAMSEILRVISSSPTDVQPVFDTIASATLGLCDSVSALVFTYDGTLIHLAAIANLDPQDEQAWRAQFPRPPSRETATARAILTGSIAMIPDVLEDPDYAIGEMAAKTGFRSALGVPLIRDGKTIGAIGTGRRAPGPFHDAELALLKTFADQAVIAIENVRLFNETKEALERQTATAEVLKVISESPTNLQPVFDSIAERAAVLSSAKFVYVTTFDGELIHMGAAYGPGADAHRKHYPVKPSMGTVAGRVVLTRTSIEIPDMLADSAYEQKESVARIGFRCALGVPMIREGQIVGSIVVARAEVGSFADKVEELLKTFADQAVIAIENVRLFNETNEALQQQTAVAEILRVISSSPTDVQPVLEAIAERAAKLCDASAASMYMIDGDALRHLASRGASPDPVTHVDTLPINRDTMTGRAVLERRTIQVADLLAQGNEYPLSREIAQGHGHRTVVVTPLLREGQPFGAILLRRNEVRAFSAREIGLLRTFGDQAAIALENVRLFNETKEALEQQRASGEVLAAISSSIADTAPVFETILASCERLFAGKIAVIDLIGEDDLVHLGAYHGPRRDAVLELYPHPADASSATGSAIAARTVVHYPNVGDLPGTARHAFRIFGIQAAIGAPMIWENRGIGAIWVARDRSGPFSEKEIALLRTFADQAVIAIQNARLFREIQDKSRQLEVANKHKSDFLANMSHELRTPLNAIIGFSEVLLERLFGDLNVKQDDYLKDIHSSGRHLLSLINDILDLSKIEAGRMELEPSCVDVAPAIANALTLVRERAQHHAITLAQDVDPALGTVVADERKLKQILLNLLSNAVKFTPDGGRIDVTARRAGGFAEIAVRDTGIGIATADRDAVFEEFRQVGRDYTRKQEGTGLGLALTRKFVELHGGRIRLESAPGQGSTFTFTIPLSQ